MNSSLIETLKPRVPLFVSQGLLSYEKENGLFSAVTRSTLSDITANTLSAVFDRISKDEPVSINPLKSLILEGVFKIGVGTEYPAGIYRKITIEVEEYTKKVSNNYSQFLRVLKEYERLLTEAVSDVEVFSASSIFDLLQTPEEYQYSENQFTFSPKQVDEYSRKVYTLFPKERYWEEFRKLSNTTSYSPLGYNRVAGRLGKNEYRLDIYYRDLIIYNEELYKLNSNVESPSRQIFAEDQWTKYNSKRLNSATRFNNIFDKNIQRYYTGIVESGFDINSISSDSKVLEYSEKFNVNEDLLTSTFGGEGKKLFNSLEKLKKVSDYFGGYEGSIAGGFDYIARFSEYLFGACYGRNKGLVFEAINNETAFGKFDLLFLSVTSENRIAGLNFLNGFLKSKSFVHNQRVSDTVDIKKSSITYNPVFTRFKDGLEDRYKAKVKKDTYSVPPTVDLLLSGIDSLYRRCLYFGDIVNSMILSLDEFGRLNGSEGLGSVEPQLKEMQRIFPPSQYMNDLEYGPKPGLTGVIKFISESYSRISSLFLYTKLPGQYLEFILKITSFISEQIKTIITTLNGLSISSFKYIPNISTKLFQPRDVSLINFLRVLGFKDSEVNRLLESKDFSELISLFAPISNSDDIKSFFKGFELSQLIYEIGGETAIDTYLSFLYSNSSIDGLLNILRITQKDKSKATYVQISKYPKLIGLLIGLTYAIDPSQLYKFNEILKENNLTLLESVNYLYESGQKNIIKSKEDIELLTPIIDQVIQGNYKDSTSSPDLSYAQANSSSPIALKQWTEIINDNLGNISSTDLVRNLYDKSVGLTPRELLEVLGISSPTTSLGQMLDGFNGGNFTKFLQYANITGLGIKLGYYNNSMQLNNFELNSPSLYSPTVVSLLEELERIVEIISITQTIFESDLDYTFNSINNDILESLIYSQNKTFETLNSTISGIFGLSSEEDILSVKSRAGNGTIIESPGTGNSRVPNRIPVLNSITPEQFRALFVQNSSAAISIFSTNTKIPSSLINNFIKFAEENKLVNGITNTDESTSLLVDGGSIESSQTVIDGLVSTTTNSSWQPATEYETPPKNVSIASMTYMVPTIYKEEENVSSIKTGPLGVSYIPKDSDSTTAVTDRSIPSEILSTFDPVKSCKRFGGDSCDELYANVADRCVTPLNKSLYPEEYKTVPGLSSLATPVDRPLGSFVDFKPSNTLVPTSSYATPPTYASLPGINVLGFGSNGEPFVSTIQSDPIVFETGGGDVSEYNNTEFGIIEGIKAKLEKNSEFNCAALKSPFKYQICMNIVKCKKFSPPFEGKYYLSFCPKVLSGGRLK